MKAVVIFLAMMIFNFSAIFIIQSDIFTNRPTLAEGGYLNSSLSGFNISLEGQQTEEQQATQSRTILDVIFGGLTFDWMFWYLPSPLLASDNIQHLRIALNAVGLLIASAAIIELFMRRSDVFT